jgi:hypothetical protein
VSIDAPLVALAAAAAFHAGFQATVTTLVYPALLASGDDWAARHAAHGRRIVPLVALTYGALLLALVWALAAGEVTVGVWVAGAAFAALVGVTAFGAAPQHGLLGRGHEAEVARRLVRVDRWRCLLALLCFGGAVLALMRS